MLKKKRFILKEISLTFWGYYSCLFTDVVKLEEDSNFGDFGKIHRARGKQKSPPSRRRIARRNTHSVIAITKIRDNVLTVYGGSVKKILLREQGWRSGESACLPPMWPEFNSRSRRHMWVEFVVALRGFSRVFRLSPLRKNQHF